jgi:hypothetical protein
MATINDLPIPNFSEMSDEELQALILETRGRRRNPDSEIKQASVKKAVAKAKKGKAVALTDVSKMVNGLSKEQAAELLKKLKG